MLAVWEWCCVCGCPYANFLLKFCTPSDCWSYVYEWTLVSMINQENKVEDGGDEKPKSEVKETRNSRHRRDEDEDGRWSKPPRSHYRSRSRDREGYA